MTDGSMYVLREDCHFLGGLTEWCLKNTQSNIIRFRSTHPYVGYKSTEYSCPNMIRNVLKVCDASGQCNGAPSNRITGYKPDYKNIPKCQNNFHCPQDVTLNNGTDEMLVTSGIDTDLIKIWKACTNWVIEDKISNITGMLSFSESDETSGCLYDIANVGETTILYCPAVLHVGFYTFTFDKQFDSYIGQLEIPGRSSHNKTDKYVIVKEDQIWVMKKFNDSTIVAKAVSGTNQPGFDCPNNFKWNWQCDCHASFDCKCGNAPFIEMNPPTIIKKELSECQKTCHYPMQYQVYSILSRDENTYINGFHYIKLNDEGVWEAGTEGNPDYNRHGATFSSVCPHDEPVWLKHNHLKGKTGGRGNYTYYGISSMCTRESWYTRQELHNVVEEATDCDILEVYFGDRSLNLTKSSFDETGSNEWAVIVTHVEPNTICTQYNITYTMKLLPDTQEDGQEVKSFKWGIWSSEEKILARTNDFPAQFPADMKSWTLLDNRNDMSEFSIWKGYDIHGQGQNTDFMMVTKLPKCYKTGKASDVVVTRPNYYQADTRKGECFSSTILMLIIGGAIGILLVVVVVYSRHRKNTAKPPTEPPSPPKRPNMANAYNRHVNNVPYLSELAKVSLKKIWIPQPTVFPTEEVNVVSENKTEIEMEEKEQKTLIGSGFFGNVYKAEILLYDNLGAETKTLVAIKLRNKDRCCGDRTSESDEGYVESRV